MNRILVLGINYAPEEIGIAVYTTGLCEALAEEGIQVDVVTTWPYYPSWRANRPAGKWFGRERRNGVDLLRCPIYVPKKPSGARRLLHHISFAVSAFLPLIYRAIRHRPDMVLCIAPSLVAAPAAVIAARLARAPSWLHIQDYELDAALATGLIDQTSAIVRLLRFVERRIYAAFDQLSSISRDMCARLPKGRSTTEIRNWADSDISPLDTASPYRERWDITTRHVALYSGNLALKQGVELILEAARLLAHRQDLTFILCGNGPTRALVDDMARVLPNVRTFDLQPKNALNDLLALASVHLLPQRPEAAGLVLPSKLTNMLASGRPVVTTAAMGTDLAREVEGCGTITPPNDTAAFAAAIEQLLDNDALRQRLGQTAAARAVAAWSKSAVLAQFQEAARNLVRLTSD